MNVRTGYLVTFPGTGHREVIMKLPKVSERSGISLNTLRKYKNDHLSDLKAQGIMPDQKPWTYKPRSGFIIEEIKVY